MERYPPCTICGETETQPRMRVYGKHLKLVCDDCFHGDNEYYHEGHERGGCFSCKMD